MHLTERILQRIIPHAQDVENPAVRKAYGTFASVVGIGCNSEKTHPIQYYYNKYRNNNRNEYFVPKLHAEINCINSIRHLDINFQKVKLYIYRVLNDKPYGISRPCPSCMAAIKDFGIKNIYYTTDDGYAYEKIL